MDMRMVSSLKDVLPQRPRHWCRSLRRVKERPVRHNSNRGFDICQALPQVIHSHDFNKKGCAFQSVHLETNGISTMEASRTAGSEILIELRNVHKSFGSKHILKGANFKIYRGEAVGIIGASGSGKSTTLRLMAGLLAPDKGEILIKGIPRPGLLSDTVSDEGLRVGMVFQSGALFDSLTVEENVGFLLYERSRLKKAEIQRLVKDCLSKVGLKDVDHLYPSQLSGGMRKRVALARAIVCDHRSRCEHVLMYDEPTAGLDPVASTVVEDLMRSMHGSDIKDNNGLDVSSYIVVTHQHSTIRRAVDRLIFLHDGIVAWEGTPNEFDSTNEAIVHQFSTGSLDGPIQYV